MVVFWRSDGQSAAEEIQRTNALQPHLTTTTNGGLSTPAVTSMATAAEGASPLVAPPSSMHAYTAPAVGSFSALDSACPPRAPSSSSSPPALAVATPILYR